MLQHALTAPVFKALLASAAVLAGGAFYESTQPEIVERRLVLHAEEEPGALYLTAWERGDVVMAFQAGEALRPIRFTTRAWISDGCRWEGSETLIPLDDTRYAYDYSETILECQPGAVPARKTPRQGLVTIAPR